MPGSTHLVTLTQALAPRLLLPLQSHSLPVSQVKQPPIRGDGGDGSTQHQNALGWRGLCAITVGSECFGHELFMPAAASPGELISSPGSKFVSIPPEILHIGTESKAEDVDTFPRRGSLAGVAERAGEGRPASGLGEQ